MNPFRPSATERPLAVRATLVAVGTALVLSALGSVAFTLALDDSLASGLVTFAIFGGLAAFTAGFLAWELASSRACPRCRREQAPAAPACRDCGYDLRARPRFACTEGHRLAFEPGLCDCGRRLLPLAPPPLVRHALPSVWIALGFLLAVLAAGILVALAGTGS